MQFYCLDAKDMINKLLRVDATERLSIPEILNHRWLETSIEEEDSDDEYNFYIVKNENSNFDEKSSDPPNINNINIENLFFEHKSQIRLSFKDYCYIANDFYTQNIGKGQYFNSNFPRRRSCASC
jgi:serine/threonine protein kinase